MTLSAVSPCYLAGLLDFRPSSVCGGVRELLLGRNLDGERQIFPHHPSSMLSSGKGHIVPVRDSLWAGWMDEWMERWCFFIRRCRAVHARGVNVEVFGCLCGCQSVCLSVCQSEGQRSSMTVGITNILLYQSSVTLLKKLIMPERKNTKNFFPPVVLFLSVCLWTCAVIALLSAIIFLPTLHHVSVLSCLPPNC